MRKILYAFIDDLKLLIEIGILILAFFLPTMIDANRMFSSYITSNGPEPGDVWYYLILQKSNVIIGIALCTWAWWRIRKYNKDNAVMNNNIRLYHQHFYLWYWFISHVLGVKKCKLVKVPIYMQVRLVINSVFDEFVTGSNDYPEDVNDDISIDMRNFHRGRAEEEINLVLADTYPIEFKQLPHPKNGLPTVIISRNCGKNYSRAYSSRFLEKVTSEVRKMKDIKQMNIFATLNPKHCLRMSEDIFSVNNRGNIEHLYVYQQSEKNGRHFTKAYRVF